MWMKQHLYQLLLQETSSFHQGSTISLNLLSAALKCKRYPPYKPIAIIVMQEIKQHLLTVKQTVFGIILLDLRFFIYVCVIHMLGLYLLVLQNKLI